MARKSSLASVWVSVWVLAALLLLPGLRLAGARVSGNADDSSGVCLTTKGDRCWPVGLVQAVHHLNAVLFLAVKGGHRFIVQPGTCEKADLLFRTDKRDWADLHRSVPWYESRCNPKRFVAPGSLCGHNWRVPPDMHGA